MASVLARLQGKTQQLKERQNRKIFVSSDTVQAYRVAHERKELLTREYPLVLALADGDYSSSSTGSISMIDGSVGPELKWTLTNINHILKTVSKFGEPTYLFANILDNDSQAFVAVTLRKGTPAEELEHLDGVLGRVSQLHIADKKPKQIPDAGDVVNAIGKGLMGILGINNKPSQQRKEEEQQKRQDEADRSSAAATAAQRAAGAGFGTAVNVHGRPVEDNTPLAPPKYTSSAYSHATDTTTSTRPVMGVRDKAHAEARLAALKTEMAREGAPPSAPDVKAAPTDTTRDRLYTPSAAGTAPYPTYLPPQQQRRSWEEEAPRPGVLSNPYASRDEGDSSAYRTAGAGYGGYAPATASGPDILLNTDPYGSDRPSERPAGGRFYPSVPHDVVEDQQPLAGYNQGSRTYAGHNAPAGHDIYGVHDPSEFSHAPKPGERGYEDYLKKLQRQAQGQAGSAAPDLGSGTGGYNRAGGYASDPKSTDYVSELRREADEARREWERTQQEAADRAKAAATRDGGWGAAGGRGQQQQQRKKEAPNWLEVLGTVFAGGPAYAGGAQYAPDL